jgi:hypothetical protein
VSGDLNSGPHTCEPSALPLELAPVLFALATFWTGSPNHLDHDPPTMSPV